MDICHVYLKVLYAYDLFLKVYAIVCHGTLYLNDLQLGMYLCILSFDNTIFMQYMPIVKYRSLSDRK